MMKTANKWLARLVRTIPASRRKQRALTIYKLAHYLKPPAAGVKVNYNGVSPEVEWYDRWVRKEIKRIKAKIR